MRYYTDDEKSAAWKRITEHLDKVGPEMIIVWDWNDGIGGAIPSYLEKVAKRHGLTFFPPGIKKLKGITQTMRMQALKRDGYKCQFCGGDNELRAVRTPAARGKDITSIDDVLTMCKAHTHRVGHVGPLRLERPSAAQ